MTRYLQVREYIAEAGCKCEPSEAQCGACEAIETLRALEKERGELVAVVRNAVEFMDGHTGRDGHTGVSYCNVCGSCMPSNPEHMDGCVLSEARALLSRIEGNQ